MPKDNREKTFRKEDPFEFTLRNGHKSVHDVYTRGDGPPVVVMQELPGIDGPTFDLCDRLNGEGFSVVVPHLFGPIGKTATNLNAIRVACMRREFHLFARHRTSPIVDWLKALCRKVRDERGVQGVGLIGMCLTGNFAISMVADDAVLAAVSSQPSMPFAKPKGLHMSGEDIDAVRTRLDEIGPIKAFRFERDPLCPLAKFKSLDEVFNDGETDRIEMKCMSGRGHSVLTGHFSNEPGHDTKAAFDEMVTYFRSALSPV